MTVRAVLCDLDDTLFDHAHATRVSLASLHKADQALGGWPLAELEQRHADMLELMHQQVLAGAVSIDAAREERFRRLVEAAGGGALAQRRARALARQYRREYERVWQPVAGAVALLEAIKQSGRTVAIVTNNITSEQQVKLARCGLDAFVDELVTSEDVGALKPDVKIFKAALDRLGVPAKDAVMVGDAWPTDIAGARAAGLRAVWLNRRGLSSPDATVVEIASLEPLAPVWRAIIG